MSKKEIRNLNNTIASYTKQIQSMSISQQFELFEKMLELEGLEAIDSFEAIPASDILLDTVTDVNNRWQRINSTICTVEETAMARQFQEFPFDVIQAANKALRCIKESFPNKENNIKMGLTEVHTA